MSLQVVDYIERKKTGMYALLQNWSGQVEGQAKTGAPWTDRTAHARQSLHSGVEKSGNSFTLYLAHGMEYGGYLEKGTAPHLIRPKSKKALFWPGATHPVKQVNHPGTRPYPIVRPTMEQNKIPIRDSILNYWSGG